ncbi:MAG: 50S ribosomal protein L23 [bacterium]|nr:50S ribosomal protein L23 [bacterium]
MSFLDRFRFKKKPFKEMPSPADIQGKEAKSREGKKEERGEKKQAEENKDAKVIIAARPSALSGVISRPFLSEKASLLSEQAKIVFEVERTANKRQIAEALKALYGVEPLKVHVLNMRGRWVHYGKILGKTKARKKAIATFPQGTKIDIYK